MLTCPRSLHLIQRVLSGAALLGALLAPLVGHAQPPAPASESAPIEALLGNWLAAPQDLNVGGDALGASELLKRAYRSRQYRPIWSETDRLNDQGAALVKALHGAETDGLDPDDYHVTAIDLRLAKPDAPYGLAEVELLLSDAFLRYTADLGTGRLNPRTVDPEWFIYPATVDGEVMLDRAANTANLGEFLHDLAPPHKAYMRLREALAHYRQLAATGGWPSVADGPKLRKGDRDPRVAMLRKRLRVTGEMGKDAGKHTDLFDAAVETAVRRFQARHGLQADGVVGSLTVQAMNVPVQDRVAQILMNMERWRWMPRDLGQRYVVVNMTGFQLDVMEQERTVLSMRVIVGKPYRRTPVFSSALTYLVFHPYWNIPPRIAVQDILPKLQKDPGYLGAQNIKVYLKHGAGTRLHVGAEELARASDGGFPYKLRQDPGPHNPLGQVKFLLPNPFDVYLHDTPSRGLFNKPVRMFSSGCIRLEKPLDLARYLLQADPKWDWNAIQAAIDSKLTRSVRIPDSIPIYLIYWTAWVDEDGSVQFRDDIYERDQRMEEALAKQRFRRHPSEKPQVVYRRIAFR